MDKADTAQQFWAGPTPGEQRDDQLPIGSHDDRLNVPSTINNETDLSPNFMRQLRTRFGQFHGDDLVSRYAPSIQTL